MESKDKTKIKLGLIGVAAAVILAGIVVGAVFVRKYSPSKKYMDGYEYFNVDNTFALFLKEESKDKPYFAARIENIKKYQ